MRQDMAKVIVEKPRIRTGTTRKGRAVQIDDMSTRESMRRRHVTARTEKRLNENLNPLFRYLEKAVGRNWNKVYAEICKNLRVENTVQDHVRTHLHQFVATSVTRNPDGTLSESGPYGHWHELISPFFVNPKTGQLMRNGRDAEIRRKNKVFQAEAEAKRTADERIIGPELEYHRFDHIWYQMVFADRPQRIFYMTKTLDGEPRQTSYLPRAVDLVTGKNVPEDQRRYRASKRQLSRKELAALGLVNGEPSPHKPRH